MWGELRIARDSVLRIAAAATGVPVVVGFTLLGATVIVGRAVVGALGRVLGWPGDPPRHHGGRVRDQIKAAQDAARASGVLRRRK